MTGSPPNRHGRKLSRTPPAPVTDADYLLPLVSPVPVNWDAQPGADGLDVLAQLYRRGSGSALPVLVKGALEFALYEGKPARRQLDQAKPFCTWRFADDDLRACRARSAAGWGYAIRLDWGPSPPRTSSATLTARYLPPKGRPVHAEPITIAIGPR